MSNPDNPMLGGVGAFGLFEIAEVGLYFYSVSAIDEGDAEDVLAEPGGRSGCPAVAEAVAVTDVAELTKVAVDVVSAKVEYPLS